MSQRNVGIGVLIKGLSSNEETVRAIQSSIGKRISDVVVINENLLISFEDGTKLNVFDGGQSCCEHRYMTVDDDLSTHIGERFLSARTVSAPDVVDDDLETHEVEFLEITTDKDSFKIANHNEHNGYYGGFDIEAKLA
jgi:hypothetical protein